MDIYNVIERIRKRPALYLGGESITALWHFIFGYTLALLDNKIEKKEKSILPISFSLMHEYAALRLGVKNIKGWHGDILDYCGGDEKAALYKFFEIYDDFTSEEIKRCERAVLTKENIKYNNSMEHGYSFHYGKKEPLFREPAAAYIAKLSFVTILSVETKTEGFITYWEIRGSGDKDREEMLSYADSLFGRLDSWEEVSPP